MDSQDQRGVGQGTKRMLSRYRTGDKCANKPEFLRMTSYDRRTLGRTIVMAGALCTLAFCVMLATDGAMTTTSDKVGRLAVMAPLLGSIGALLANAQAKSRGETRALAALGVHPSRACLGALLGAGLIGLAGAAALAAGAGHLDGLFPRLDSAQWVPLPNGEWALAEAGIRIAADGEPRFHGAASPSIPWDAPRAPVVLSIVWMTLALVDWVREEIGGWERLGAMLLAGGAAIAVFHLVAAGKLSGWGLLAIPIPLLAHAWLRRLASAAA